VPDPTVIKTSVEFSAVLDRRLRVYMRASGSTLTHVVREAVGAYITRELDDNDGTRKKFDGEMAKTLASAGENITLISRRKSKKKDSSSVEPGAETQTQK
jgi:predicted DNA-binding protein